MKKILSLAAISLLITSCSFKKIDRDPSGIILSNHGNSITENSQEILADLKITGCSWADKDSIIKEFKLEKIAKTILDNQHSFFGFDLLNSLEKTPICFTNSEFNSNVIESTQHKIFKPQKFENKIVAINASEIIIINQPLFNKLNSLSKQLLFLHEASHLRQREEDNQDLSKTSEIQEMSVKGLISLIDKIIKSPKSISPKTFTAQLNDGKFEHSSDEIITEVADLNLWLEISKLALDISSAINFDNYNSSYYLNNYFNKTIDEIFGENNYYSKLKDAFDIFQKNVLHFKHLTLNKNNFGRFDEYKVNNKTHKLSKTFNNLKSIKLSTSNENINAYYYLLHNDDNEYTLLNHIEYYKSSNANISSENNNPTGTPLKSLKIFPNIEEFAEISISTHGGLIITNGSPYILKADVNSQTLLEPKLKLMESGIKIYTIPEMNSLLACEKNESCTIFSSETKVIFAGDYKTYGTSPNDRPEFRKAGDFCVSKYTSMMGRCSTISKDVMDCIDYEHGSIKWPITYHLDTNTCTISNYSLNYKSIGCSIYLERTREWFSERDVIEAVAQEKVIKSCLTKYSKQVCNASNVKCR